MYVIEARNVNHALPVAIMLFRQAGESLATPSRNGMTLEWPTPVTTVYHRPMERVLFHPLRDANPFFHLFESLWILAGRQDVAFLKYLLPNIADYSDDGFTFHGAYGRRLRVDHHDQLLRVSDMLRRDPETRRAVCGIWDVDRDLAHNTKDLPCNDLLAFRVREGFLDLTVYNRSNDAVWGAYGANAVQFAFILEYVAAMTDLPPGRYYQVSNNFHVYLNAQWDKVRDLPLPPMDPYADEAIPQLELTGPTMVVEPFPLFQGIIEGMLWGDDLGLFFDRWDIGREAGRPGDYATPFFKTVVLPAWSVFLEYKSVREAVPTVRQGLMRDLVTRAAEDVAATDWALAMSNWLQRRLK